VTMDPAGQVARADPATTDPAAQVDLVTMARADQETTGPADRVDPDSTDPVDRVVLERGTATTTAATSTTLHGVMDPHRGAGAIRHDRTGTGHFRRPVAGGTKARSTTGATRKRLSGTRSSTSSASTSSEFGSRCKDSPHETPASPIGGAGVAHLQAYNCVRVEMKRPGHVMHAHLE
jgi:hypothetical protein